jgi:hypothetical protein
MPGLMRAVAATAVVAGTAQATRNAVNRRQAEKNTRAYADAANTVSQEQAQQQPAPPPQEYAPPPPPPAPAAPQEDVISQLERLGALKAQGILTEDEFNAQKAKLLAA